MRYEKIIESDEYYYEIPENAYAAYKFPENSRDTFLETGMRLAWDVTWTNAKVPICVSKCDNNGNRNKWCYVRNKNYPDRPEKAVRTPSGMSCHRIQSVEQCFGVCDLFDHREYMENAIHSEDLVYSDTFKHIACVWPPANDNPKTKVRGRCRSWCDINKRRHLGSSLLHFCFLRSPHSGEAARCGQTSDCQYSWSCVGHCMEYTKIQRLEEFFFGIKDDYDNTNGFISPLKRPAIK